MYDLAFNWPVCGEYLVDEDTFRSFLTKVLERELSKKKEEGVRNFVLRFENHCPRCEPEGSGEYELRARKPKKV